MSRLAIIFIICVILFLLNCNIETIQIHISYLGKTGIYLGQEKG